MQQTQPPPLKPKKSRPSCLVMSAIGCGSLLLIGALIAIGLIIFFLLPGGRSLPIEAALSEDTLAVAHLKRAGSDAGIVGLIEKIMTENQRASRSNVEDLLPENLRWIAAFTSGNSAGSGIYAARMLPEILVCLEPSSPGKRPDFVALVQLGRLPRGIKIAGRAMLGQIRAASGKATGEKYRGRDLIRVEDGVWICLADSTLLVASRNDLIRGVLDRAEEMIQPTPFLHVLTEGNEGPYDLYGEAVNQAGLLDPFLPPDFESFIQANDMSLEDIDSVALGINVVSADQISAKVSLTCREGADPEPWAAMIKQGVEQGIRDGDLGAMDIQSTVDISGNEILVRLEVSGIEALIERKMAEMHSGS